MQGIFRIDKQVCYIITKNNKVDITNNVKLKKNLNIIPGDTIELENDDIKVIQRTTNLIPGVLHTSSKISFGTNSKGNIIKKFTPLDRSMPNFFVATKNKNQSSDIYAIIKFEYWNLNMCYGSVVRYIGDVGCISSEHEIIQQYALLNFSKKKILTDYNLKDNVQDRLDLRNECCISVDPDGCLDIDDALHIKQTNTGYEVGIHIADVSAFVLANTDLDNEISQRCESVYLSNKQVNMLPDSLSLNQFSLLANNDRAAFSIIVHINSDGSVSKYKFVRSLIHIKKNYSYDEAQEIIDLAQQDNIINTSLLHLYNVGQILYNKESKIDTYDVHKMIEIFMVLINSFAARTIYSHFGEKAIVRKHYMSASNTTVAQSVPDNIKNKIGIYNLNKAEYCFAIGDFKHFGLNEQYYTHFSSPIRRYFDVLVHRMMNDAITNNKSTDVSYDIIEKINHSNTKNKICQNMSKIISKIATLKSELLTVQAYIIGFELTDMRLHIPELDLDIDINLFSEKLGHLVTITNDDETLVLSSKETLKEIKFAKGNIVKAVIAITMKDFKKIKLKLVDPNVQELFSSNEDIWL